MDHLESQAAMRDCIDACQSCHEVCTETISHCLSMGGEHVNAEHINTMMDCAQVCATSADFMLRGSASSSEICDLCAIICDECAESCEALEGPEMKRCADECRRCAEACRAMVEAPA